MNCEAPGGAELAEDVENKVNEKYDMYLGEELLCADYASSFFDEAGARECARELLEWL